MDNINLIYNLKIAVCDKAYKDWLDYKNDALSQNKEEIFRNSYRNAIAEEWKFFFENNIDDEIENLKNAKQDLSELLGFENIITTFTEYMFDSDSVNFSQEEFAEKFKLYFE